MKEYAIYPFRVMNISQNWNQGNHVPHWQNNKNYSDKPWDEACEDSKRSYFIPQNDFIIEEVLGLGNNTTNSVRLKSVNKLYIPYKEEQDYLYLTLTHMNEDNLAQVKKGQVLKKGTMILMEGTDGNCTGNHFHITANLGKYYGLLKNSNGAWCYTYEKSLTPEQAFYVDERFTIIKNTNGSNFKFLPKETINKYGFPVERNELVDQVEILADDVRARSTPRIADNNILGYMNVGIYNVDKTDVANGYTWYENNDFWFAFSTEWCRYLPKKDLNQPIKEDLSQKQNNTANKKGSIFAIFINLIKRIFRVKS